MGWLIICPMQEYANLSASKVLILEDEAYLARQLKRELHRHGLGVTHAPTIAEARTALQHSAFEFVLLDVNLPDGIGLELLDSALPKETLSIVMTSEGRLETAIEALRRGAVDFLCKPFDLASVPLALERAQQHRRARRLQAHRQQEQQRQSDGLFFGKRLEIVRQQVDRILSAEQKLKGRLPPVLIQGETGVGKTTLARWIHQQGQRGSQEMVEINCATLPEALAESELFGHEKGAFTDAREARQGLMEAASGSTLFLDEITSLALPIQAKLLTALEDGHIRRVGGQRRIPVDVRIICASLQDLRQLVAEGRFREDLMHRLDLLRLQVPPLRECPEDLPELARHLLRLVAARYGHPEARLAPVALNRITTYDWPGNLRELAHELERALILEDPTRVELSQLGAIVGESSTQPAGSATPWLNPAWELPEEGFSLEAVTQAFIELALSETEQNVSAAARRLGVPRDFIRYRLKKKG